MDLERLEQLRQQIDETLQWIKLENSHNINLKTLVANLQVYHTELEAQNTELQHADEALRAQISENQMLFDKSPVGYVRLSGEKFLVKRFNSRAAQCVSNAQILLGKTSFYRIYSIRKGKNQLYSWLRGDETQPLEIEVGLEESRWLQLEKQPLEDGDLLVSISDITELVCARHQQTQQLQELLREKEQAARARQLTRSGFWSWQIHSGDISWSPEVFEIFAMPPDTEMNLASFQAQVHPEDLPLLQERIQATLERDEPYSIEHRLLPDEAGNVRWVRGRAAVLRNRLGEPVELYGAVTDITKEKEAQQERERLLRRLQMATEAAGFGMMVLDPASGNYLEMNDLFRQQIFEGEDCLEMNEEALLAEVGLQRTWESQRTRHPVHVGGKTRWIESWGGAIQEDNKPLVYAYSHDVTEEVEAEQSRERMLHRFLSALQASKVGFSVIDAETFTFLETNERYREMLFDGQFPQSLPDLRERILQRREEVEQCTQDLITTGTPKRVRFCIQTATGERWIETNAALIHEDGRRLIQTFTYDVTEDVRSQQEREQLLQRLREEQAIAAQVRELTRTGYWRWYPQSNEVLWSDETYEIFDVPKETSLTLESYRALLPRDAQQTLDAALEMTFSTHEPYSIEHRVLLANGREAWVRASGGLQFNTKTGEIDLVFGSVTDITERRSFEQERERLLRRLQLATEAAGFGVIVLDPQSGDLLESNELWRKQHGWTGQRNLLNEMRRILQNRDELRRKIKETLLTRSVVHVHYSLEVEQQRHWIAAWGTALEEEGKLLVHAYTRDITEEVAASEEQEHLLRLSALGEASASLAHELKSPLAAIDMKLEIIEQFPPTPAQLTKHIHRLQEISTRIRERLQHVQNFSRRHKSNQKELCDFSVIWANVWLLSEHSLQQASVRTDVDIPATLPKLWCNPTQLEQLLLNLINNARDAMDGCDPRILTLTVREHAKQLHVQVKDTGAGMSQATQQRLFEKFFTTKEIGKGTGLGMGIVQKVLDAHQGQIDVQSALHEGTTMSITLPLLEPSAS
jgi:PAS domain S-box-containing protein